MAGQKAILFMLLKPTNATVDKADVIGQQFCSRQTPRLGTPLRAYHNFQSMERRFNHPWDFEGVFPLVSENSSTA